MSDFRPPVDQMLFILHDVLGFSHQDLDRDTCAAVLAEAANLASEVLAPLNTVGDREGAHFENGKIRTAQGFKEAYKAYCDGGWNAVPFDPAYGGQGVPWALAFAIQEMWQSANMAFGLCPLLNQGAVKAIATHGSQEQKAAYLPKLISGEWAGTMNLTEAHAGSDLGLIRTKATRNTDGSFQISGQKIFITYGDHDLADNIIHLVLARIEGAPDDIRGISLFIVPKFLEDGTRNGVDAIGLEHKLGVHASPTCTMNYENARGFLVGAENMGLKYMFTMMNNARLSVGLQGVAIAERATQKAVAYAAERVQGKSFSSGERVTIDQHADVRRMLMTMQSLTVAGRALTYSAAMALDSGDENLIGLLTPIVKAWCTDMALEVALHGMQVHGGMGYIEETGAAQYYRDARILPIYEGTNGIQAADLVFRKIGLDGGAYALSYIESLKPWVHEDYLNPLAEATRKIAGLIAEDRRDDAAWLSSPYLASFGYVAGGAMIARMGAASQSMGNETNIQNTEEFYQDNILPRALGWFKTIKP